MGFVSSDRKGEIRVLHEYYVYQASAQIEERQGLVQEVWAQGQENHKLQSENPCSSKIWDIDDPMSGGYEKDFSNARVQTLCATQNTIREWIREQDKTKHLNW